jgi:cytochrome c oxidase subunit II
VRGAAALLGVALLAGCGRPAALAAAGPQSGRIAGLWAVVFWLALVVQVAVLGVLLWAFAGRARTGVVPLPLLRPDLVQERHFARGVGGAAVLTALIVVGLLVASALTARALGALGSAPALTVEVTGHQWWWEIEYWDPIPAHRVRTANELHVPVGEPVLVKLRSRDVIHSFWVPALNGKTDQIPGHPTSQWIQADAPGTYTGQCAEFCGYQHAHMRLLVIAESRAAFDAWRARQLQPAPEPTDDATRRGREVFLTGPCVLCHTIAGTAAGARLGPDLTHLAGRTTIASGTLPNTTGHLAGWILDPEGIKPGTRMPATPLEGPDLQSLLAYLGTLR